MQEDKKRREFKGCFNIARQEEKRFKDCADIGREDKGCSDI